VANSALQRKNMVESQIRPSDITDRRITGAMQDIERERFLPAQAASLAYMDEEIRLDSARSQMAPRVFARLLQLAEIEATDKVLIIGALRGYSAAVTSRLAARVIALEIDPNLALAAKSAISDGTYGNVKVVCGPLETGWPEEAPFDAILVEGAVERIPDGLCEQLAPAGRLVAIEAAGKVGHAVIIRKSGGSAVSRRVAFDVSAPVLPGFKQPKAFTF
jgi:protein-L-isoaspartate(D-aspartate) O-methyltransferase